MANQRKPFEKICENTPNYSLPRELIMTLNLESHKQGKKPSAILREILYDALKIPDDLLDQVYAYEAYKEQPDQSDIFDVIGDAVINVCKKGKE